MAVDLDQWWGNDLNLSPSGDLASSDNLNKDNQRIVRRICTNGSASGARIGEYLFHLTYGGSAPWYVGRTPNPLMLEGIIRSQMFEEASVSHTPEPLISTQINPDGSFYATIQYSDSVAGQLLPPLTFKVS